VWQLFGTQHVVLSGIYKYLIDRTGRVLCVSPKTMAWTILRVRCIIGTEGTPACQSSATRCRNGRTPISLTFVRFGTCARLLPMETILFQRSDASRRLLVALAHPDDESFGPAGTIVHYARQGMAVQYICATRGEAGDVDPGLLTGSMSLAELRTQELQCAARHLGLAGVHFLGYHDSGMANAAENQNPACLFQAPLEEVVEKITALIRQIRPQVVLTFDPTGGSFHPDHVKMNRATTLAFHAAGNPERFAHQAEQGLVPYQPQKLYYMVFPLGWVKAAVWILPLFGQDPAAMGRNKDINLKQMVDQEPLAVTTRINISPYLDASEQAALCHVSQVSGGYSQFPRFLRRWLLRFDRYARIVPPFWGERMERDLFAGVTEDES
jgi:LmbE family N-acetylglucosaminyl deacetylase